MGHFLCRLCRDEQLNFVSRIRAWYEVWQAELMIESLNRSQLAGKSTLALRRLRFLQSLGVRRKTPALPGIE